MSVLFIKWRYSILNIVKAIVEMSVKTIDIFTVFNSRIQIYVANKQCLVKNILLVTLVTDNVLNFIFLRKLTIYTKVKLIN